MIDLDGFKAINDTHGHAAGDACLQHFTLMAQTRLRPGDMLARTGGDEFCVVLPASTLREGAMIARRVLEVCRDDAEACAGADIPIAVSIGVAQWTAEIGTFPDRLMAAADQALYAAKKEGKNCHAVYDPAPPTGGKTPGPRRIGPCARARRHVTSVRQRHLDVSLDPDDELPLLATALVLAAMFDPAIAQTPTSRPSRRRRALRKFPA